MTRQQEQPTGASRGTRMLTAFGETPEQIGAGLQRPDAGKISQWPWHSGSVT